MVVTHRPQANIEVIPIKTEPIEPAEQADPGSGTAVLDAYSVGGQGPSNLGGFW